MAQDRIYQIKGELFHGECLTTSEREGALERPMDEISSEDECATCGDLLVDKEAGEVTDLEED